MTRVGRIASTWRYPVKSMAAEPLDEAVVTLQGVAQDRLYAFVQADSSSPFPWLTGRELADMLRYEPRWVEGERAALTVRTPRGDAYAVTSDELRDELTRESGRTTRLLANYRGSFDVAPVSLMSAATVARIAEASGTPPEPRRFRMNFYIDTDDGTPFGEDAWVGRVLRIGESVRVGVTERDKRCAMITLAPHGGAPLTPVLRAVAELNDAHAGVYGAVLTPGTVRPGDEVVIED
ncbi:MAG: MOSC domain-containing protein [Chloroflexi bacterium]|nr:MOSC domain-containing protein [Chloroflexota bacterium]MDA1004814.1 MOSC domain-containing protein [Chloroflexota bacterium]